MGMILINGSISIGPSGAAVIRGTIDFQMKKQEDPPGKVSSLYRIVLTCVKGKF
jgi:hypothetical protein